MFSRWSPLSLLALALAVLLVTDPAAAQDAPGTWRLYSSMRSVQALAVEGDALWAGTEGGLFRYDTASGEIERYTTVEGLANLDVRALAYDAARGAVWVGYDDGVLDRLDVGTGAVTSFYDIARSDRFPQRMIHRLRVYGDTVFAATGFGLVVFDAARGQVRDTYEQFGGLTGGIAAYDVLVAPLADGRAGLWVGTEGGVASAPLASPNLRVPSAWSLVPAAPAPALSLGLLGGQLLVGRGARPGQSGDLHRLREDGVWGAYGFANESVTDLVPLGDRVIALSTFFTGVFDAAGGGAAGVVSGVGGLQAVAADAQGRIWVGTDLEGLVRIRTPEGPFGTIPQEEVVHPGGPLRNQVRALDVGRDGTLWIGYVQADVLNGLSRLSGGAWDHFSSRTGFEVARGNVEVVRVDRQGRAWGGTEGGGLMRVTPEGEVSVFRSQNSTLRPDQGTADYIVVLGIDEDADGRIWVTNRNAPNPLHVWDEAEGWTALPRPAAIPSTAARFGRLQIDRFGQKWVGLISTTQPRGAGFAVIRTGAPRDPSDDEAVVVTGAGSAAQGTGLPDAAVNALREDLDGRVWVGTGRGLASIVSPGSVFANPALAEPRWARVPTEDDYFLRDLSILSIAVDPAGRKWLGSADGAWLINAEGNTVLAHLTPENSPLPSASVVGIAVDAASGTVYFATSGGVAAYRGDSVAPAARAETLRVYPNPYRPEEHPGVRVEGLLAETRVRILTADGQTVAAFDARGGSATWDGRDQRTGRLVSSGVYVVAASGRDGGGTAYGKIAVIR